MTAMLLAWMLATPLTAQQNDIWQAYMVDGGQTYGQHIVQLGQTTNVVYATGQPCGAGLRYTITALYVTDHVHAIMLRPELQLLAVTLPLVPVEIGALAECQADTLRAAYLPLIR